MLTVSIVDLVVMLKFVYEVKDRKIRWVQGTLDYSIL